MSIFNIRSCLYATCATLVLAQTLSAQQQAPYGSCMITAAGEYQGLWCWPLVPGNFGDPCVCPTPAGDLSGTIQ